MEIYIIFIVLALIISSFLSKRRQKERERKLRLSGIKEVDNMPGRMFEDYLQALLKTKGYKVTGTSTSGDYGADLILSSRKNKIVVQTKRYSNKVGLKAVQEIVSAKGYYGADECWVITNNYFTKPALNLARSNQVKLVDRDMLIEWMYEEKMRKEVNLKKVPSDM